MIEENILVKTSMDEYLLSQDEKKFYYHNGYLLIKGLFTKQEMNIIRKDMDEFANGHYTNYLNMHHFKSIREIHRNKKMCDIADQIINMRAIPIGCTSFFCKPNNPLENGSVLHQDNAYNDGALSEDPNAFINIGLAVDDADINNSPLMVVPGSHKLGPLPHKAQDNFSTDKSGKLYNSNPIGNECELPSGHTITQLEYKSGDAIILHSHILHRAKKNKHPTKWRRALYYLYIGEDISFSPGRTAKRTLLSRYDSKNL